jgi:serine protease Do
MQNPPRSRPHKEAEPKEEFERIHNYFVHFESYMNATRRFVGISVAATVLASVIVAGRFVAHALENNPSVRVDNSPLDRDLRSGNSYSPVVKKVAPSVVNIYSTHFIKERYYSNPIMADPFFRQFFGNQFGDDVQEITRRENWLGSGVIVTADGYILTANHVVESADEIKVDIQNDKTEYAAKVVGMDPPTDVAILKIEAKNLPAVTLGDSDQLEVGDVVLALGNPFGIGQTVTRGIISALSRSLSSPGSLNSYRRQYQDFIQTDAAINQGNSGGALVDAEGRLIGINDAIVSPSGTSAGIGFAIPINLARSVMEGFLDGGRVARGYLGVDLQDLNAGLAKGFGAPDASGALVTQVGPDTPAAKGGLMAGDVVVAVNGKKIVSADNLIVTVSRLRPGTKADLKVFRSGEPKTISVALSERPDITKAPAAPKTSTAPAAKPAADALDGVVVNDLTPRLRYQLHAGGDLAGALVTDVADNSNSYDAGLRAGDVILEINKEPVTNAQDAKRMGLAARSEQILLKIWRPARGGGVVRYLTINNARPPK